MYKQQWESVKQYFAGFNFGGLESRVCRPVPSEELRYYRARNRNSHQTRMHLTTRWVGDMAPSEKKVFEFLFVSRRGFENQIIHEVVRSDRAFSDVDVGGWLCPVFLGAKRKDHTARYTHR